MRKSYAEQLAEATANTKGYSFEEMVAMSTGLYNPVFLHKADDIDDGGNYDILNGLGKVINNTTINLGIDLTKLNPMAKITISVKDVGSTGRSWGESTSRVFDFSTGADLVFKHVYDNDYFQVYPVDLENGLLRFVDIGRNIEYSFTEIEDFVPLD